MFRLQQHRIVLTTIVLVMLVILGVLFPVQAQEGDRIAEPFLDDVVQLTVTFSGDPDNPEHGFGFIVGERDDLLYVVTANHVVRKDTPDVTAQIQVQFFDDRGNLDHFADLLNLTVDGVDLALLRVHKPFESYVWQPGYFYPSPKRGDRVWFIGRNQDWFVPLDDEAGTIRKDPFLGTFPVSLKSVEPGTSGAPLITPQGIVGMIIEDSSEQVVAIDIATIRHIMTTEWKTPWDLEEFQTSAAAPTPTPLPPTPTPRPTVPEPTPAPSQERKEWTEPVTGMEFVWVPEGCFQMGCVSGIDCSDDEKPVHEVCLDGFWMGKYEVTQAQWQHVMGNNPSNFKGNNRPVEQASWDDAQEFIKKLNSRSNFTFRLPSEAEWEYAARAGTQTAYYFGNNSSRLGEYAWYDSNSGGQTHPVGTLKPNEWGLYDMHGNVWEWCQDIYRSDAYRNHQRQNPLITSGGSGRVIRGGSWRVIPWVLRSANRGSVSPVDRFYDVGLRLVRKN